MPEPMVEGCGERSKFCVWLFCGHIGVGVKDLSGKALISKARMGLPMG